jgi:hypothetical protein
MPVTSACPALYTPIAEPAPKDLFSRYDVDKCQKVFYLAQTKLLRRRRVSEFHHNSTIFNSDRSRPAVSLPADSFSSHPAGTVDTHPMPLYIQSVPMGVTKIQSGQLWKKNDSDEIYLVTRLYNEALSTFAMLRKSGAETEPQIRVKVERSPAGQALPGFTPAQEDEKF